MDSAAGRSRTWNLMCHIIGRYHDKLTSWRSGSFRGGFRQKEPSGKFWRGEGRGVWPGSVAEYVRRPPLTLLGALPSVRAERLAVLEATPRSVRLRQAVRQRARPSRGRSPASRLIKH